MATVAWTGTYEELPLGAEETSTRLIDGAAIDAFADAIQSHNPIHTDGDWARATGLEADLSAVGFGRRVRRCAMIVEDRVLTHLALEKDAGLENSSAEKLLLKLGSE